MSSKHLKLIAALLATALVVGLGTVSFQRKVATFETLGFDAALEGAHWTVTRVDDGAVGLLTGDRLLSIGVGEGMPASLDSLRAVLHGAETTTLFVQRGPGIAESVTYVRPSLEIDRPYLVLALVSLLYLLIGLFTLLRRGVEPSGLFFVWALTSAALYLLSPTMAVQDGFDKAILIVDQIARTVLPALTLHLLLVFPTPLHRTDGETTNDALGTRTGGAGRWAAFAYLPAVALLAIHFDLMLANGRLFAGPPTVSKLQTLANLEMVALVALSLLGAAILAWRLGQRADWEARRQVQWVLIGLVGGYVPFLGFYVAPRLLGATPRSASWIDAWTMVAVLALGLVPLGFAYAILKYRLFDLGSILRNVVANGLTLVGGIFAFVVIEQAVSRSQVADAGAMRSLLAFVAGVGIAGVLVPTRSVIVSRLDNLRYGARAAKRRALERLGAELAHEHDLDRLTGSLMRHLEEGLSVEQTNLLIVQPGGLVPLRPQAGLPSTFNDRGARDSESGAGGFSDAFWRQDVIRLAGAPLVSVADREQQLYAAGYRYLFPLMMRDQRIGVMTLGNRADGAPLGSDDLTLARALLNQAAMAIENARLLDEVQRQVLELTRLEASAKGILESSPAGLALLDAELNVVQANHAFAAIVGTPRAELPGRAVETLFVVSPLPAADDGMVEVAWCDLQGDDHYLQIELSPHAGPGLGADSGPEVGIVITVQDISEQRRMEASLREKERLSSLGMLAAGVAHEVNTPLTGISSYAQMLIADTDEDDPQRRTLEKIERQTFRASQIVNDLLAFARHRGEPQRPVDLCAVVRECTEMAAPRVADAGIELVVDVDAACDAALRVEGHEGELTQVVTNLIGNAIDAMARQDAALPRRLAVTLESGEALETGGDHVELRVIDSGPGIPADRVQRVFEPFFSSKLGSGGTGLGLAISQNIIRRHGGRIEAVNQPERGCAFVVRLPRETSLS